ENGRYASQALLEDVRLAGYFGEFNPANLSVTALPDPSATSLASLAAAIPVHVQGYHVGKVAASANAIPTAVTALLPDLRANTDVLVLRRVSTCSAGPTTGTKDASCDAM